MHYTSSPSKQYDMKNYVIVHFFCDMQNDNCCQWRQTCRDMSKSTILFIALNFI